MKASKKQYTPSITMYTKYLLVTLFLLSTTLRAQQMNESWYRSQAAFDRGENQIALQWLDSCLAQKEKNYLFWIRRGEILYNQGNYQSALESLLKANKLKQGSSSYPLAMTYCTIGDTASCFACLRTYLSTSDKLSEGTIKLEPAFETVSSTKQWKKIWSKEWYSPFEKLVVDAEYCLSNHSWDEALDLLNPRLQGSRPRPQLLALRAEAYFGLSSYRAAIDDYTIAIKRSKKNHQYIAGRVKCYIALGKNKDAIDDITKAIELSGGNPKYFRVRAEAYFKNKQYALAFDDISYYINFYPSDTDASFLLALIAVEDGRYVDALFSLGKLIKSNPNESKYYYLRGLAYIKTENYSVAETDLNIAIAKSYNLADSYYQRGIARLNLGKKDDACTDIEAAAKKGNFSAQELLYKHCKKPAPQKW